MSMRPFLGAMLVLTCASAAHAQLDTKARAEALFEEAQTLMRKGDLTTACPKFAASQKLDPAVGTLLNLATCYERQGKTASAWAAFHEAATAAAHANQDERARFAEKRATELARKLPRVVIRVSAQTNLEVKLDGTVVDSSEWGTALPLDPGQHSVEVSAPGKHRWTTTIDVGSEATQSEVAVPKLADEAPTTTTQQPLVTEIEPPPPPRSGSPLVPLGIVVGAIGFVSVGIGLGFGVYAMSKNNEALTHCPMSPQCNDQAGVDLTHDAQTSATAATVAFIVGGVALATGVTLLLVGAAPGSKRAPATARLAPLIGPGLGGAVIGGTFR
jgi:hypothetical protein